MTERRRPSRRGRSQRSDEAASNDTSNDASADANPYLEAPAAPVAERPHAESAPMISIVPSEPIVRDSSRDARDAGPRSSTTDLSLDVSGNETGNDGEAFQDDERGGTAGQPRGRHRRFRQRKGGGNNGQGGQTGQPGQQSRPQHQQQRPQSNNGNSNGNSNSQQSVGGGRRNSRRNGRPNEQQQAPRGPAGPIGPVVVDGEATGLFDLQRDAGFLRKATYSYLADPKDPLIPLQLTRQAGLRRGDLVTAAVGHDQRGRVVAAELTSVNGSDPETALRRPEFQSLTASYPDRKLTLETGKPAKGGPELTRRAIDLIAPIGYGQRALIVAPARAGKTMLLQAVIEGVAINHPQAHLFVLLVDERPEEVSDMITLGYGEVVASSFDMPAARHTDVAEMTLERARRLVELGQDVVIVLDSITRLARAYNTVERGTGRTLSGGLDSSAMAKPKAFFGSARAVAPEHGGGSLTIIATALVETGSRMDDVIFEEFKGTGNCEIKLDRSLAEKRIFPAVDIGVSGTRREDKLFAPEQIEHVYTLRRGLQQMPSSSAMEWLIKRIAGTPNNDALLSGL
ncbi:MAG: transcription termination factor Rho [Gemmatimonadaceae bacterium]